MHDEHNSTAGNRAPDADADRWTTPTTRKGFIKGAAIAGAGVGGLGALSPAAALAKPLHAAGLSSQDVGILKAAQIAEALAVTTYTNIINTAPFFTTLPKADQAYLTAALQEEMSHYLLEESLTGKPSPYTTFYYPANMFSDAQTTLNILVTLEDAFIAAYLIGVRRFNSTNLRVTAARIMGVESDHRTLARVIGGDVSPQNGGPIEKITGIQKVAEDVEPANNNAYERTLGWTEIKQALEALTPFVSASAAEAAGFDAAKPYTFTPFTPKLPSPLGEFISYKGG